MVHDKAKHIYTEVIYEEEHALVYGNRGNSNVKGLQYKGLLFKKEVFAIALMFMSCFCGHALSLKLLSLFDQYLLVCLAVVFFFNKIN